MASRTSSIKNVVVCVQFINQSDTEHASLILISIYGTIRTFTVYLFVMMNKLKKKLLIDSFNRTD